MVLLALTWLYYKTVQVCFHSSGAGSVNIVSAVSNGRTAGNSTHHTHTESLQTSWLHLHLLWIHTNNSGNVEEPDALEVAPMLSSPLQAVVQEIGHALIDSGSCLHLKTHK